MTQADWLALLLAMTSLASRGVEGNGFCVKLGFKSHYNGTVNHALNGLTCQRWDLQNPHKHHYTDPSLFPEATLEDVANYCRTPDGSDWPWCFTTSPKVRSQACSFDRKLCADEQTAGCYMFGVDYQGSANKTIGGIPCQQWTSQTPHSHSRTDPSLFPDNTIEEAGSFCRNPVWYGRWPWCYTMDSSTRWDYCYIHDFDFCVGPWFFTGMITNKNYQGRVNVTATGKPCQRWDAQTPHTHDWVDADFPEGSLEEAADFCRYLGDVIWPWCYTMTGTNWEYCSVQDIVCRRYQSQDL